MKQDVTKLTVERINVEAVTREEETGMSVEMPLSDDMTSLSTGSGSRRKLGEVNATLHNQLDMETLQSDIEQARIKREACDYDGAERYLRRIYGVLKV